MIMMSTLKTRVYLPAIGWGLLWLIISLCLLNLDWKYPDLIQTSSQQGTLKLELLTHSGEIIQRSIDLKTTPQPIALAHQTILSSDFSSPNHLEITEGQIEKNNPALQFSIILASLIIVFLIQYILSLVKRLRNLPHARITYFVLFGHFFILSLGYYFFFPGILNYDSFAYFERALALDYSFFWGAYYGSIVLILTKLFLFPWIITFFQVSLIYLFLIHLYLLFAELRLTRFYLVACLIFYLVPANFILTFHVTRDSIAHWILTLYLIELWKFLSKGEYNSKNWWHFGMCAMLPTFLRPEATYLLILAFLYFLLRYPTLRKFSALSLFSVLLATLPGKYLKHMDPMSEIHYQTTVLINPLSYILKRTYPNKLSESVQQELGSFFKNDNLIKYANDYDINPYHEGGLNYDSSEQDYYQFRNATLKIILNNPKLFLENRLIFVSAMLGFQETYLASDEYYTVDKPFQNQVRTLIGADPNAQPPVAKRKRFLDHFNNALLFKSYLLPLVFLLLALFLTIPGGWYQQILCLLGARTILVILVAPATYFKYHYALWLFAIFSIPCVIYEFKSGKALLSKLTFPQKLGKIFRN